MSGSVNKTVSATLVTPDFLAAANPFSTGYTASVTASAYPTFVRTQGGLAHSAILLKPLSASLGTENDAIDTFDLTQQPQLDWHIYHENRGEGGSSTFESNVAVTSPISVTTTKSSSTVQQLSERPTLAVTSTPATVGPTVSTVTTSAMLMVEHPNFGSGGSSFSEVLSSSYDLELSGYGDESEMGSGHNPISHNHSHHGLEDSGHCIGSYHGADPYIDGPGHDSGSQFPEVLLDRYQADIITQPIGYQMSPPHGTPASIPRGPLTPSSTGSPQHIQLSPSSSPISPNHTLPSFLDTYSAGPGSSGGGQHHVLDALSPHTPQPTTLEPRFTFKTEPGTPVCEAGQSPSPSSYASHYQAQSYPSFLKKEPIFMQDLPTQYGGLDFYQPQAGPSYSQFAASSGSDYPYHGEHHSEHAGTLPASLQGALQGALGGNNVGSRQRRPHVAPGKPVSLAKHRVPLGPPPPPALRVGPSASSSSAMASTSSAASEASKHALACAVCGDNAACQHYGVRTCEGCKGFFKRTVQKNAKYVCLAERVCPVDKRRRNRCQFCRFQKCLAVGMVKEVVRTDGLKGRRGRLPSKPKSPQEAQVSMPMSFVNSLIRAYTETSPDVNRLDYSMPYKPESKYTPILQEEAIERFYNLLTGSLESCRLFFEKIPGIFELCESDRNSLFQLTCLELFVLRFAHRNPPGSTRFVFCNGAILSPNHCKQIFGEWLDGILKFSEHLRQMNIDQASLACLSAITLVNNCHGLKESHKVEQLKIKIVNSLKDHIAYNPDVQRRGESYFKCILGCLQTLRNLSEEGHRRIFYLKHEPVQVRAPPLIETIASRMPF